MRKIGIRERGLRSRDILAPDADSGRAPGPVALRGPRSPYLNHTGWLRRVHLVDGAHLERLQRLGLTSYEARAYLALLRRDSSTAAETARLAGLPRQRVYDVLSSLVEKGLASTRPGKAVKYAATPPEQALEGLVAQHRQQLADIERETASMVDTLMPAYLAGQEHTDPLEYIEVLRDRRAINERFGELEAGIKDEILVFTKPPYATPVFEHDEGLEVVSSHSARSMYEYSAFDDPRSAEAIRRYIEAGEEARFVDGAPAQARDHRRAHRDVRHRGPGRGQLDPDDDRGRPSVPRQAAEDRVRGRLGDRLDVRRGEGAADQGAQDRVTHARVLGACALAIVLLLATTALAATGRGPSAPKRLTPALSADLALLQRDPRIARLVPGNRPGEIAYFVVLDAPKTAAHRTALERAGARVLNDYRTLDAFAVASRRASHAGSRGCPDVARLAPVEVIQTQAEQEVDQSKATTADVGATQLWSQGVTGTGIRIAVLDTGTDVTHPDLDDRDFRRWSSPLNPPKVVDARSFLGGGCVPLAGAVDGHGHGTHVAGIATGTGEGTPLAGDNGRYAGIAPDAELAVGKVLTDAGAGLNSDLLAAMEWAAMPAGSAPCAIGAHVVNLSLGSESRPARLNTGSDVDLVSQMLNRLAVRYGTLFVAAAGNSGPFLGSVLEAPGAAAQALTVGASAKDYDVNHDDTLSGDACAGYQQGAAGCSAGPGLAAAVARRVLVARPGGRRVAQAGPDRTRAQHRRPAGGDRRRNRPGRPQPEHPHGPALRDGHRDVDGRAGDRRQRRAAAGGVPRSARHAAVGLFRAVAPETRPRTRSSARR